MTELRDFAAGRRDLRCGDAAKVLEKCTAVAFDMDGTLVDSIGQILRCTNMTFTALGLPKPDDGAILRTIGMPLTLGLMQLLPEGEKHRIDEVMEYYRQLYLHTPSLQINSLFDGVEQLMVMLKRRGMKIGFASGRSVHGIRRTLDATFLGQYCDGFCGGDEVPSKPDPLMLRTLCARLGCAESRTLMVGDADLDVKMAQNAGCPVLAVQTGVWSGDALLTLKPDLLLPAAADLAGALEQN